MLPRVLLNVVKTTRPINMAFDRIADFQIASLHDMNHAFVVVGLMFLVAGVLWLAGTRFLKRDTELAPMRLTPR